MVFRNLLVFFILLISLIGCADKNREEQLSRREQALFEREKQFEAKEADYQSLLRMRDSIFNRTDSVILQKWSPTLMGIWNSKVVCKESDCSDYVVGDQRSDNWEFTSDSVGRFAKIFSNEKLIRIFSGDFDSTEVRLHFKTDSTATKKIEMDVVLNQITKDLMKGTQTISGENKCTAKFSVELVRSSKN